MGRLSNRVVVITGASAGIGRACAMRCARDGAAVVLSARRADRLDQAVGEIQASGGRAIAVAGDVTSETDMSALVTRAIEAFGRIDVMVCNAGIGFHGPLDQTPPSAMRRLVDVNLMGTLYAAHAAMVAMRRQGHGHIVAISSIVGRRGVEGSSVYAATKAAQIALIEALRAEFVGSRFHASVVYPVGTVTEFRDAMHRDFGYAVSGAGPRQSAEQVADRVADCITSPRAEVYPYAAGWLLAILSVVAPATADRVVRRFGRRRKPPGPAPA
jgi:NADP-dependent 3-hydroxy acid dehydrogenase YdfG